MDSENLSSTTPIRYKYRSVFFISAIVPLLLAFFYGLYAFTYALKTEINKGIMEEVVLRGNKIESELLLAKSDIYFLSDLPTLHELINEKNEYTETYQKLRTKLEKEFLAFSKVKPMYYQIRYLNEHGDEVARIENKQGDLRIIPVKELQSKAERPYFLHTTSRNLGHLYVSALELNQEYGAIEIPHTPVIRYGLPLFNSNGDRKGIIITNIYAEKLFGFDAFISDYDDEKYVLIDNQGYYLFHPEKNKEWGSQSDLGTGYSVFDDFGIQGNNIISKTNNLVYSGGRIIATYPIFPYSDNQQYWIIAKDISQMRLLNNVFVFIVVFIGASLFAIFSAFFIGNRMARKVSVPIQILTEEVVKVSNGQTTKRVPISSDIREVRILAREFNNMADNVEKAKLDLESKVRERTCELVEANKQLQQLSQAKSEFLANMSHELRTPLNAIIGFGEMLQDELIGELNEKQHRYIVNMLVSSTHLLNLINDILDISKIEANKMVLRAEKIDINKVIDETITIMMPLADKKQLSLINELPAGDWTVQADDSKITQVLLNLVSNAIKFTDVKGIIKITGEEYDDYIVIVIEDSGIGINLEDQSNIFDIFIQVDSSFNKKYQGSGLGLPLVKKLLELHRGKIWLTSEIGKGSKFFVQLNKKFTN